MGLSPRSLQQQGDGAARQVSFDLRRRGVRIAMATDNTNLMACRRCGESLSDAPVVGLGGPVCPRCQPRPLSSSTRRPAGDVLQEVWHTLTTADTWGQVIAWSILLGTTFVPVVALWGANRLTLDDPLLPVFVGISALGGAVGMPWCYPKKGYWLPGVLAGLLFGPGVFLAFGLLAPHVMNRLVLLGLTILGGGPSFALYVFLLYRQARQSEV